MKTTSANAGHLGSPSSERPVRPERSDRAEDPVRPERSDRAAGAESKDRPPRPSVAFGGGGLGAGLGPSLREVCLLIGRGGEVLWSDASASPLALPDSRARWEAIWQRRVELAEIAHSHPLGPRAFSAEDESTMAALGSALGRALRFSVVAPAGMIERRDGADRLIAREDEPWWADLLRLASGMTPQTSDAAPSQGRTEEPEAAEDDDEAAP